ncbi:hypothetical protein [Geomonas oryzae]|uniref:hypothetical protein n=1 Tax=Geomonas oryzae TaxID=2364273 RepID=UPI00100C3038|nr:hypothetical protein [Geomonas oryzae]
MSITEKAFDHMMGMFAQYGHRPSADQQTALKAIQSTLTAMLMEEAGTKYYLSSLDPGVGKTTAIVSWLNVYITMYPTGGHPHGILICVDRLSEIERYVQDCKLPQDSYAVLAGKQEWKLNQMGLGSENIDKALVLFTTKEQVRKRSQGVSIDSQSTFNYKGKPRAVKVWDESLLLGKDIVINPYDFGRLYTPLAMVSEELVLIVQDTIHELTRWTKPVYRMPILPDLPPDFFTQVRKKDDRDLLELFFRLSGQSVTLRRERRNHLIIDCIQSIPSDFPPCLILDASGRIKGTYKVQRKRLDNLEHLPYSNKSYRNLTISVWDRSAGKGIITDLKTVTPELVKVIKEFPGERFLFLLYQDQVLPLQQSLSKYLPLSDMERLQYCTWGQHTATNEFCEIPNVIGLSAYQYPDSTYDAMTRAAGLMSTEEGEFPSQAEINMVKKGEISSDLLQGVTRSMVRKSEGDTCPPTRLWLIAHPKTGLRKELPVIFPEATVQDWKTQSFTLTRKQQTAFDLVQEQLKAGLESFPCAPIRNMLMMQPTPFKKMLYTDSFQAALSSVQLEVASKPSGLYFQTLIS